MRYSQLYGLKRDKEKDKQQAQSTAKEDDDFSGHIRAVEKTGSALTDDFNINQWHDDTSP